MVLRAATTNQRIFVRDHSYVGTARRSVREFAEELGLQSEALDRLSIVISELASNLVKHTREGGEILISDASDDSNRRIRIFAIDRGPGIENLDAALEDGVSSTSTLGGGFGALRRMTDTFEVSSNPGEGTVVIATIAQNPNKTELKACQNMDVGFVCVPHPKESSAGDAVAVKASHEMLSIMLVDSLGHGEGAAIVSQAAAKAFFDNPFADITELFGSIQSKLTGSRGAAIALVQILPSLGKLEFLGVGNISSRVYLKYTNKGCASVQGIVGGQIASPKKMEYEWAPAAALLMYSDGIKSAAQLPCWQFKSANLLAGEIYRSYSRLNDDASVLVVKDLRSKQT